ncbi:MAG: hypothetical protein ACFB0B_18425 [Thermonemataceae bacterium]
MHSITFEIQNSIEIMELFDKTLEVYFIHKLMLRPTLEWFSLDLKIDDGFALEKANVRSLAFDLQTDLEGIKKIIALPIHQLRIYQFDRKVPDTLMIENLPEASREEVLKENGLKHFFWINFEFITIASFYSDFLETIEHHPTFKDREKAKQAFLL